MNEAKYQQLTFILTKQTCPGVILNGYQDPQVDFTKYLSMYFDCKLNWKHGIFIKRKQLELKLSVV